MQGTWFGLRLAIGLFWVDGLGLKAEGLVFPKPPLQGPRA